MHSRLREASLDGGSAVRLYGALAHIRDYLAREGDPIFADRLASILLASAIQTDTVAGGNKRRRQISSELDSWSSLPCEGLFVKISLPRWVPRSIRRANA
jgi:hypothetical protein